MQGVEIWKGFFFYYYYSLFFFVSFCHFQSILGPLRKLSVKEGALLDHPHAKKSREDRHPTGNFRSEMRHGKRWTRARR